MTPTVYGLGGWTCPHCDFRGTKAEVERHIPQAHEIRDLEVSKD